MLSEPQTPFGYTIFADDIREEKGGKHIFVGVYDGGMIIEDPFPVNVSKLCLRSTMYFRATDEPRPLRYRVWLPQDPREKPTVDQEVAYQELFAKALKIGGLIRTNFEVTMSPANLTCNGRIKVRALYGDDEIKIGSIGVRHRSDSSPDINEW